MNTVTAPTIQPDKNYPGLRVLKPVNIPGLKKLVIPQGDLLRFIPFEEILYCKATSNYTHIFTREGKSFLCCKTLKDIEAKLPAHQFIRIHRAYIINGDRIVSIKKQPAELELEQNIFIPISRSKKAWVYQLFI
jgi:two-component system, LytTR family, response regulator